ncbi:hypothetical protein ABGV42_00615 [Paenibacillus pabuli]|uniref:hypothetical protein n=1 Tax=Paenibacillus pabuli TaxID=1472 RepID=UPI003242AD5F
MSKVYTVMTATARESDIYNRYRAGEQFKVYDDNGTLFIEARLSGKIAIASRDNFGTIQYFGTDFDID